MTITIDGHSEETLITCVDLLGGAMRACLVTGLKPMSINALTLGIVLKSIVEIVGELDAAEHIVNAWSAGNYSVKIKIVEN